MKQLKLILISLGVGLLLTIGLSFFPRGTVYPCGGQIYASINDSGCTGSSTGTGYGLPFVWLGYSSPLYPSAAESAAAPKDSTIDATNLAMDYVFVTVVTYLALLAYVKLVLKKKK